MFFSEMLSSLLVLFDSLSLDSAGALASGCRDLVLPTFELETTDCRLLASRSISAKNKRNRNFNQTLFNIWPFNVRLLPFGLFLTSATLIRRLTEYLRPAFM